jgi:hypothetical protein
MERFGTTRFQIVYSSAMNVNVGYNVVLPPEYDSHPDARFPVVYILHGAGADENGFLLAIGLTHPLLDLLISTSRESLLFIPTGDDKVNTMMRCQEVPCMGMKWLKRQFFMS